jgi:hypothetical protein
MASSKSIRFKVSVLLAIPLTSLVALWGFAATVTVGDSVKLFTIGTLYDSIGQPGGELSRSIQREHLLSAEYLASRSDADRDILAGQRMVTDQARARFQEETSTDLAQSAMTAEMKLRFVELVDRVNGLDGIRSKVDSGQIGPTGLSAEFARVPDAMHLLTNSMSLNNDLPLYHQSRTVTMISQAKGLLSRERALAAGALALGGPLPSDELRLFTQFSMTRTFLMEQALPELESELRKPFTEMTASSLYARFTTMEDRLLTGGVISAADWRSVGDDLEASYERSLTAADLALTARAAPTATGIFVRAGVAGALGLVAVIASLLVSYRVGRGLTRELAGLRRAAADLADVRLPRVMEKLRRGEKVDMAVEAPLLEPLGSTTEVLDVAAAFDSVQHRAVDAAVEQARLREGVGHAFRNLARRSQSLLQRQLKLLDGMQKQAENPEALENLFRLDHLTTRMRRHAEGLVILSGGAAGRRWRSSVQMEDVLRGAAAQVENYARVRIHSMGGTTLVGNAVADMMHLFAEIIENATVFSPPGSQVTIQGELVGRGFAIEIEDRGLGLSPSRLAAINERLASPPELDPAETDRLGFAVVGLLASRYGVDVALRASPYGGTGVVIVLPEDLLGDPEPPEPTEPPVLSLLPERVEATVPARSMESPTSLESAEKAMEPASADVWKPLRRGNGGLPRRERQANLSSRLQESRREIPEAEVKERSPEEARAVLSSLQAGWRRGRSEDESEGEKR